MSNGVERLRVVQEKLKEAGVRDVKFCWAPDAFKTPYDELCGNVADWLEAYLRGDFSEVMFATDGSDRLVQPKTIKREGSNEGSDVQRSD